MTSKWKKVLYEKQDVPDNYVDESFLSDLRKNVNLYKYTWGEAFTGVCAVTHEVSSTVLFVVAFIFLKDESCSIAVILVSVAMLIIISFIIHQITCELDNRWKFKNIPFSEYLKSCVIFFTFGYMFSPILKALTETISTDTIYAMVTLMMLTHVLFQDYGAEAAIVSQSLSLNSALFAAVCLSSRLPTVMRTFALVILAVMVFVVLPLLRHRFQKNISGFLIITGIFIITVLIALFYISTTYAVLFVLLCFSVNVIFPTLFVHCQKYKENIFGPWDEAVVKQHQSISHEYKS
ncbi:phosphatidylinositol N-acetylglucosaminyltransferase subunit C-like [Stegodyphus dumicola]|uniref:phosphatidylinositol N-acetylglucosaminyltransferase subunit C-like n=1 Tax=Stegodyphus dumicola TaxID=202533 RepID=UPI0015AA91FD|nr:phosphatidylinositol N-acetylglucosaminyltransferase subunit C-like [Stegodyphus dumicola]XP_035216362.1 phosphatidylinositol N-acetylglucosaminyltransferase subunit C-like [Stegodyphus dumicola]XP_035216372.1 phosphatidylinositol N-acetylglucosaminyltransferase subunit C-like [Stegodyphus dumicola]XP_035216378.1 phosphatidylinositol N-acetylglucosaminyltransferase subunit C-like [Stegodyphus dumicola]